MIFLYSNQCNLRMVLIKLAMYNFQRFPLTRPTSNCQVNYNSFSAFLHWTWPFITEPFSFHLQFSCTIFFSYNNDKYFYNKPIFWCTTFVTLSIQIHAKGRLNKLLHLLLIFGCFRPMPLHDSLLTKTKFERLLCRTPFLFHFQLPSTIFLVCKEMKKKTKVFTSKLLVCEPN